MDFGQKKNYINNKVRLLGLKLVGTARIKTFLLYRKHET